jgi:hypothetical protein
MSYISHTPSLCNFSGPEGDEAFELNTPLPINYEHSFSESYADLTTKGGFSSYDSSYIFYDATNGWQTAREPLFIDSNPRESSLQRGNEGNVAAEGSSPNVGANHPGLLWFHWHAGSGHPGYQVQHQGWTVQCPYLHYEVHNGIPYEMGTEGVGTVQFAQELYAELQPPVEVLGVDDRDLEIFVKDVLFNFASKQALESLGDPSVLAEVARLRHLIAQVPVYADLARSMQGLSEVVHKFQKEFNDHASRLVIHLEATKRRMEGARIHSCAQLVLVELGHNCKLRGRFYWPDIPGVLEDPSRHYVRTHDEDAEGMVKAHVWEGQAVPPSSRGCISPQYRAMQKAFNVCRLCKEVGHWIRECEQPYKGCRGPHCVLW